VKSRKPKPEECEACLILFNSFQLSGKIGPDENLAALEALVSAIEQKRTPKACPMHRDAVGRLLYAERERRRAL
jgi:hypothetical protein